MSDAGGSLSSEFSSIGHHLDQELAPADDDDDVGAVPVEDDNNTNINNGDGYNNADAAAVAATPQPPSPSPSPPAEDAAAATAAPPSPSPQPPSAAAPPPQSPAATAACSSREAPSPAATPPVVPVTTSSSARPPAAAAEPDTPAVWRFHIVRVACLNAAAALPPRLTATVRFEGAEGRAASVPGCRSLFLADVDVPTRSRGRRGCVSFAVSCAETGRVLAEGDVDLSSAEAEGVGNVQCDVCRLVRRGEKEGGGGGGAAPSPYLVFRHHTETLSARRVRELNERNRVLIPLAHTPSFLNVRCHAVQMARGSCGEEAEEKRQVEATLPAQGAGVQPVVVWDAADSAAAAAAADSPPPHPSIPLSRQFNEVVLRVRSGAGACLGVGYVTVGNIVSESSTPVAVKLDPPVPYTAASAALYPALSYEECRALLDAADEEEAESDADDAAGAPHPGIDCVGELRLSWAYSHEPGAAGTAPPAAAAAAAATTTTTTPASAPTVPASLPREPAPPPPPAQVAPPPSPPPTSPPDASAAPGSGASVPHPLNVSSDGLTSSSGSSSGENAAAAATAAGSRDAEPKAAPTGPPLRSFSYHLTGVEGEGVPECFSVRTSRPGGGTHLAADRVHRRRTGATPLQLSGAWLALEHSGDEAEAWMRIDLCVGSRVHSHTYVTQAFVSSQWEKTRGEPWWVAMRPSTCRLQLSVAPLPASVDGPLVVSIDRCSLRRAAPPAQGADAAASCYVEVYTRGRDGAVGAHPADFTGHVLTAASAAGGGQDEGAAAAATTPASTVSPILWSTCTLRGAWGAVLRVMVDGACVGWREVYAGPPDARARELDLWPPPAAAAAGAPAPSWVGSSVSARAWVDATTAPALPLFRAPARAGGSLPRFLTLCVESVALRNLPGADERGTVLQLIRRVSPADDEAAGGGEDGVVAEVLYRSSDASTTPCPQWQLGVCCEMPNPAFARGGAGGGGGGSADGGKAVLAIEVLRDTAPRNTFLGCFELELDFDRWAAKVVEGNEGGCPTDAQLRTPTRFRELNARLTPRKLHDAHWNTSDLALLNRHGTLGTVTVTYSLSCAAFEPAPAAFEAAAPAPSQELPGSTLPTPAPAPVHEEEDNDDDDDDDDEDTDEGGVDGAGDVPDVRCAFDLRLTVSAVCGFAGAQDRRVCVKARQVYSGNEANEVLEKTMATELAAPAVDHRGLRHYAFGDRSCFPLDAAHDARSHLREQAAAAASASHPSERGWAVAAGAACGNGGGAAQRAGRGGRSSNIPFLKKRFARERRRRLRHPDDVSDRGGDDDDDEAEGAAAAVAEEEDEPLRPSQILASFEISACDADDVCMGRATLVVQKKGLTFGEAHEVFLELAAEADEEVAAGADDEQRPLGSAGVRVTWEVLRTPLSSLVIVPSFRPPPTPTSAAAAAAQLLSVPSPQTAAATANRKLATKFCVDDGGGCPPPPWVSTPPSLWNVDLDDRSRCCDVGDAPWGDEVCRVTAVHSSTGQRLDDAAGAAAAAAAATTSDAAFPLRLYPRPLKAPTLYVSQWSGQHMLGAAQVCLASDAAHGSCEVSGGGAEGLVPGATQGGPGPGPGFGNVMAQCSFAPFQLSWKWLAQQKDVCEGPTHCVRRGCFIGGVGGGGGAVRSRSAEDDEDETAVVAAAGGEDLVIASEPLPSLASLLATCVVSLEPPPGVLGDSGGGSSGPQAILDSLQMFVEVTDTFTEAVLLRRPLSRFSGVHLASGGGDDDGTEPALNSASFRLFMSAGEAGADGKKAAYGAGDEGSSSGVDGDGSEEDSGVNSDGCVATTLSDIQRVVRSGTAAEPRVSFVLRSRCRHPVLVVRADLWVEPDAAAAAAAAQSGGSAGAAAAAAAAAPRERRRCHVSVLEGKHLSALSANARAPSALRVVGRVGPARNPRRFATRAFAEAACPLINERFDFPMRQASEPLRLEVWGVSEGRQTCLGTADAHLSGRASAWVRVSPPGGRAGDAAAAATQRPVGGLLLLDWRHVFEAGLRPASVPDLAAEQQRRSVSVGCVLQPQATKSDPRVTGAAAVQLRKGRVLQVGGVTALGTCCNVLREYVAAAKQWTAHGVGSGVPRHGHSAVLHSKCVYVFGGHGLNGYNPGSVGAGATAGSTSGGDGAAAAQGSLGFLKSTMCYNTTLKEWSEVPTTGTAEDYRAGHTAVLCGHKMLVWGGWELVVRTVVLPGRRDICSTLERRRSDMVCLDLQDCRWRRVAQGGTVPRARAGHTAELHDGRLWVFGGTAEAGFAAASNGDVGVSAAPSSVSAAATAECSMAGDDSEVEDLLDTTPSQAPSPSSASAAAVAAAAQRRRQQQQQRRPRRRSGCVANGVEFLSCLHAFDLETKTWTQVAARGDVPLGREGHSSALATGDDATSTSASAAALYVYGGRGACGALGSCYAFAFDASSPRPTSGFWRRVVFDGCPTPPPRSGHTMLLDSSGVVPPARNHRRPPAAFTLRRLRLSGDDAPTGAAAAEPTSLGVAVEILPSPPQCLKASAAAFYGRGGGRKGRVWLTLKRREGHVGWRVISRLDLFGAPPASRRAAAAIFDEARPCALLQEACSGDRLEVEATAGSGGGEDGAALVAQEVSVEVHYTHPDRRAATNPSIGAKLMVFGGSGGKGQAPCAHQYVVPCAGERMSQMTFVLQYQGDRTTVAEPTVRIGKERRKRADHVSKAYISNATEQPVKQVTRTKEQLSKIAERLNKGAGKQVYRGANVRAAVSHPEGQPDGKLTEEEQRGVTERLYYRPFFRLMRLQAKTAQEGKARAALDEESLERCVRRLYYSRTEQGEAAAAASPREAASKKLTADEEEHVTDRLYYQNLERSERTALRLSKQYLKQRRRGKQRVLTRAEWSTTVSRLHNAKGVTPVGVIGAGDNSGGGGDERGVSTPLRVASSPQAV